MIFHTVSFLDTKTLQKATSDFQFFKHGFGVFFVLEAILQQGVGEFVDFEVVKQGEFAGTQKANCTFH